MKIAITGESGFIGRNLPKSIKKFGHEFVSLNEYKNFKLQLNSITFELCE